MKIFSILALTLMSLGISAADLPPSTRWQPLHFTDGQAYFVDDSFASNRAGWLLVFSRTDSGSWQDEAPLVSRLELDCENHQFRTADHHFFDDGSERFQLESDGVWRDVTRRSVIGIAFNKSCETTASFTQAISLDFQESERLAATSDQLFRVSTVWTAIAEAENSIGFAARASAGSGSGWMIRLFRTGEDDDSPSAHRIEAEFVYADCGSSSVALLSSLDLNEQFVVLSQYSTAMMLEEVQASTWGERQHSVLCGQYSLGPMRIRSAQITTVAEQLFDLSH